MNKQLQFILNEKLNVKFFKDNFIFSNDETTPLDRLRETCKNKLSLPLFYDVHRTKDIQKAYQKLDKMNSNELQLVEIFPQFIDSLNGKNMKLNELYLIREIQVKESAHREYLKKTGSILNRLIYSDFSNDYKKIIDQVKDHYKSMNIEIENDFDKKIVEYLFIYLQSLLSPKKITKDNLFIKILKKLQNTNFENKNNFKFTQNIKEFLNNYYL